MSPRRSVEDVLAVARGCILEHGPGVPLSVIARAVGVTPAALVQRFGSKDKLVFQALLPREMPAFWRRLREPPGDDPRGVLVEILAEVAESFVQVGPALAALRMSAVDVAEVFPRDRPGPARNTRTMLAEWLHAAALADDPEAAADVLLGAAEARGFLRWVGEHLVSPVEDREWARRAVHEVLRGASEGEGSEG